MNGSTLSYFVEQMCCNIQEPLQPSPQSRFMGGNTWGSSIAKVSNDILIKDGM